MPTVIFSKAIIDQEVKRVKRTKHPRMYCIVRFEYRIRNSWAYAICLNPSDYKYILNRLSSSCVILWASKRFEKHQENTRLLQAMDDNDDEVGI